MEVTKKTVTPTQTIKKDSDETNLCTSRMRLEDDDNDVVDCLQPDESHEDDGNDDAYCYAPASIYVTHAERCPSLAKTNSLRSPKLGTSRLDSMNTALRRTGIFYVNNKSKLRFYLSE